MGGPQTELRCTVNLYCACFKCPSQVFPFQAEHNLGSDTSAALQRASHSSHQTLTTCALDHSPKDRRTNHINILISLQDIEPNFFLSLLLPLIIYSAAISMHWHTLRRCLLQVSLTLKLFLSMCT
jgi:hypothetical protein